MHKSGRSRWGRSVWPTRWAFSLHLLLQCQRRFYSAVHKSHEGGRFAKNYELLLCSIEVSYLQWPGGYLPMFFPAWNAIQIDGVFSSRTVVAVIPVLDSRKLGKHCQKRKGYKVWGLTVRSPMQMPRRRRTSSTLGALSGGFRALYFGGLAPVAKNQSRVNGQSRVVALMLKLVLHFLKKNLRWGGKVYCSSTKYMTHILVRHVQRGKL
jgi:hypothetical protein